MGHLNIGVPDLVVQCPDPPQLPLQRVLGQPVRLGIISLRIRLDHLGLEGGARDVSEKFSPAVAMELPQRNELVAEVLHPLQMTSGCLLGR